MTFVSGGRHKLNNINATDEEGPECELNFDLIQTNSHVVEGAETIQQPWNCL